MPGWRRRRRMHALVACMLGSICSPSAAAFADTPSYLDSLLTQYTRDFAPLTPYAGELISALRAMDADLRNATSPILRPIGNRVIPIHPIGFSIPPEYARAVVPAKGQGLATVIPGAPETYKYLPTPDATPAELMALERNYYADMERSYFGLTWKKAGWDCLRHLELLAAGCVPLFTDIAAAPRGAVAFLPKRVLAQVLRFPGVDTLSGVPGFPGAPGDARNVIITPSRIDPVLYSLTATALLDYTRRHLTTPRMAAHLLATMGIDPPYCRLGFTDEDMATERRRRRRRGLALRRQWLGDGDDGSSPPLCPPLRVLYLTLPKDTNDYMADTLAHGLVTLLGPAAVTQHHRRDVLYTTPKLLDETARAPARTGQYGFGFTYGNTLFDLRDAGEASKDDERNAGAATKDDKTGKARLRQSIADRDFDVVIFSLIHRGPPPLMDVVCQSYPRTRVAAVYGHDWPPSQLDLEEYAPCTGFYFAREAG